MVATVRPRCEEIARSALVEHGLPWLDRFPGHDAVLNGFRTSGPSGIGMSPAGPLDVAQMLDALGRPQEARAVLKTYVDQPVNQSHAYYLRDYLAGIGYGDLVPRIRYLDSAGGTSLSFRLGD